MAISIWQATNYISVTMYIVFLVWQQIARDRDTWLSP